jgi:hypothetical protein
MNVQLLKRLYTSSSGYKGLHIPKATSDEISIDLVKLVWDGHSLIITPIWKDE